MGINLNALDGDALFDLIGDSQAQVQTMALRIWNAAEQLNRSTGISSIKEIMPDPPSTGSVDLAVEVFYRSPIDCFKHCRNSTSFPKFHSSSPECMSSSTAARVGFNTVAENRLYLWVKLGFVDTILRASIAFQYISEKVWVERAFKEALSGQKVKYPAQRPRLMPPQYVSKQC